MISFEYSRSNNNNNVGNEQTTEPLIIFRKGRDMDNFINGYHFKQYCMVFNIVGMNKTDKNPCDNGMKL